MKQSELFAQIERLIPTLDGWASPEKCCEFAAIIIALRPRVTVEVGTWGGRGALSMALAHRFISTGKVYVVDPWNAVASTAGMDPARDANDQKNVGFWGSQATHDLVYRRFCDSMTGLELTDWVNVQRMTSSQAVVPDGISLAVIDGDHNVQAVADVERWAPSVVHGGFVYLDDLNWSSGAVKEAAKRLMSMGFVPLYQRDEGMFYQRR